MNIQDSPVEGFVPANSSPSPPKRILPPRPPIQIDPALPPLLTLQSRHGIEPDLIGGWRPKIKLSGPIPLNFSSGVMDSLAQYLLSKQSEFTYRLVFIGSRPHNSLEYQRMLLEQDCQHLPSRNLQILRTGWNQLNAKINYIGIQHKPKWPFSGNLLSSQPVRFNSNFQSGNLDYVIATGPNQFDLVIRNDSNSKGHNAWFNFKVTVRTKATLTLNIVNFKKARNAFAKGMRPYVKQANRGWAQGGLMTSYCSKYLRASPNQVSYHCLSFKFQFQEGEEIQFAYSIPYTYSRLKKYLSKLSSPLLTLEVLGQTLGGLDIPLLSIGEFAQGKQVVLVSARIHSGQPNSSFMLQGLINKLLSEDQDSRFLIRHYAFKIVPMLNPDGVLIGNFRTGLAGKDLNRKFGQTNKMLYPQSCLLLRLAVDLRQKFGKSFTTFWDFHGHSTKEGLFSYGPEHAIFQQGYVRSRVFTKLLGETNQYFRPEFSIYSIAKYKLATARAVILKKLKIPMTFTFEASVGLLQRNSPLQPNQIIWQQMGKSVLLSLCKLTALQRSLQPTRLSRKSSRKKSVSSKLKQLLGVNDLRQQPEQVQQRGSDSQNEDQDLDHLEVKALAQKIRAVKQQFKKPVYKQSLSQASKNFQTKRLELVRPSSRDKDKFNKQNTCIINLKACRPESAKQVRRKLSSVRESKPKPERKSKAQFNEGQIVVQRRILALRNFMFLQL